MKTKNNVQNGILKSMAVVISVLLVSITVSAQGFWETILENTTFNQIALAMVESNSESSTNETNNTMAGAFTGFFEVEAEEDLELESWMTNDANFSTITLAIEDENTLDLEEWMTNDEFFLAASLNLEVVQEETLQIENWMVNNENFSVNPTEFRFGNDVDSELQIENWMLNDEVWNN